MNGTMVSGHRHRTFGQAARLPYAVYNRMIDARSKRALPAWFKNTAIQYIRPVRVAALSSRHYWRMWERMDEAFRQSKNDDLVCMVPFRHWTDGKIRYHILTCMVALPYLQILRLKLAEADCQQSHGQHAHSAFLPGMAGKKRKQQRLIEEPDELQTQIQKAFSLKIKI